MMAENMKTAPFDLEKAIKGHPLVTRNGKKVSSFVYFKELSGFNDYPCRAASVANDIILSYSETGHCYSANNLDLLLDLSVPWEEPLRMGDEIEVLYGCVWTTAIFIKHVEGGGVIAIADSEGKDLYRQGTSFSTEWFANYRREHPQDSKERQAAEQLVNDATVVIKELGAAIEKAKALLTK